MTDIPTIAFIGLPLLTGCIGVGLGFALCGAPSDENYWKAIAEREEKRADDAEKAETEKRRMYLASTAANQELSNSNARLASALAAKKDRLNRIVEAFADQRSGTAKKAVKIALGDA